MDGTGTTELKRRIKNKVE